MCQRIPAAIANDDPKDEWEADFFQNINKKPSDVRWTVSMEESKGVVRTPTAVHSSNPSSRGWRQPQAKFSPHARFLVLNETFSTFVGKEADLILSLCGLWDVDCPSSEHQKSDLHAPSLTGIATLQCYYHVEWIQIHKYKHTNTNTQIQIHKSKIWVNTSSRGRPLWLWTIAHLFFAQLLKHNANVNP